LDSEKHADYVTFRDSSSVELMLSVEKIDEEQYRSIQKELVKEIKLSYPNNGITTI